MVSKNRRAVCVGVLPEEVTRCFDHSLHNAALVLQWPRLSSPRRPTHRTLPVRICSREGLSECIGFFAETNNSPTTHGCVLTYFIIPSLFLPLLPPTFLLAHARCTAVNLRRWDHALARRRRNLCITWLCCRSDDTHTHTFDARCDRWR